MDPRLHALTCWLQQHFSTDAIKLHAITNDASFRRYFRLHLQDKTYIVMDAPPAQEDCRPFIAIAHMFNSQGLRVPQIFAEDVNQGFLLLEDFGDRQFSQALNSNVDKYYYHAMTVLLQLQHCNNESWSLPLFDTNLLQRELDLLQPWFLERHLGITLSAAQLQLLQNVFTILIENALQQPQVCVHRDYHSRNLMILPEDELGILDFQCAVIGPITYDLVSLLRDCYIAWPEEQVLTWVQSYLLRLQHQGIATTISFEQFVRWFDLMGLQRHLKVLGLFVRLHHRDNKPTYLADLPRVMNYVLQVSGKYPEFRELFTWFQSLQAWSISDSH
ncbi:phosphotransferase [soil metagenome]